ncbi:MAG: hypothetical protein L6R40_001544 [Gallowayella cf. fulva]|nr:MAG: hypothetical protein L6R40_001544 [Xanthomendoza cf. fulva]
MILKCDQFLDEPFQDAKKMDRLFRRLLAKFNDPRQRNAPVFDDDMRAWEWYEPRQLTGSAFAGFGLEVPASNPKALKRGELLVAVWGVNEMRLSWPNLDFACDIFVDAQGGKAERYLGKTELFYEPEDEVNVAETA